MSEAKAYKNPIDVHVVQGVQFEAVPNVVEIFPAPLPDEVNDEPVGNIFDLTMTSAHFGFDEIFLPKGKTIRGKVGDKEVVFKSKDFLAWQLMRVSPRTLYFLASKTDASLYNLLDDDEEYEKDPDYNGEDWLYPYGKTEEELQSGFKLVERIRREKSQEMVDRLVECMLDADFGVRAYGETEIDKNNLDEVREMYGEWRVPLMLVYVGKFLPYIAAGEDSNLMRDSWDIRLVTVRNYDEGDIAG
jgi:hypothetical protein